MNVIRCELKGSILSWSPVVSSSKNITKKTSKKKSKKPSAHDSVKDLIAKTTRRRNSLIKKLFSLEKKPRCFITLLYPGEKAHSRSAKAIKRDIDKLGTRIRANCPAAWFIYSIEWKKKAGFHFHLHGCPKKERRFFSEFVREIWQRIVGAVSPKLVKVDYNQTSEESDRRSAYLVSREKFADKMHVVEHLNGAYDYGVINGKNIPHSKKVIKEFSFEKFEELREIMCDEYLTTCGEEGLEINLRHLEKMEKSAAYFNILKPKSNVPKRL